MAESTSDLLLRSRAVLLRHSLRSVMNALDDLEKSRTTSSQAAAGWSGSVAHLLGQLSGKVPLVRDAMRHLDPPAFQNVNQILTDIENAAQNVQSPTLATGPFRLKLSGLQVKSDLQDEVQVQLKALDRIDEKVRSAAEPGADRDLLMTDAWGRYERCWLECNKLFSEYVDLVRGVLLRDAGLDGDLCRIADQLVRVWGSFKDYSWGSFTIPASHERSEITAARLIRIGFPEWTVWMLPMTAHEFGHVFADRHVAMQKLAAEVVAKSQDLAEAEADPGRGDRLRVAHADVRAWIAEAFATAVMGPAYVWSAMLLRADPNEGLDCRRVTVMVEMLDLLGGPEDDPDDDHAELRQEARDEWAMAVADATRARAATPGGRTARAEADVPPELAELTSQVVKEVFDRVRSPLTARDWTSALVVADALLDADVDATELGARLREDELRRLLLAGWMARIQLAKATDNHEGLQELGTRLRLACMALIGQGENLVRDSSGTAGLANDRLGAGEKPSDPRAGGPTAGKA